MYRMLDTIRVQARKGAQWLSLVLETPGETQARIVYLVRKSYTPGSNMLSLFKADGDNTCADRGRVEDF